ncbi:hypothetical protein [Pseudaestuariivita rosea]|uniref:hypothetical protein n=1 Tax=Pseudaestuariivita rosea TaxID=2763263 RepID=UPI001ABA7901|nr:hypothetical protein [Pseudaestuariivita rosea]
MAKTASVTEADMKRVVKVAQDQGLRVQRCIMTPKRVEWIFSDVDGTLDADDSPKPKEWPR